MAVESTEWTYDARRFAELAARLVAGDGLYSTDPMSLRSPSRRFGEMLDLLKARGLELVETSAHYFMCRQRVAKQRAIHGTCSACSGQVWFSCCRRCGTREVRA